MCNGYLTTMNGYNRPITNGYSKGKTGGCYVGINNVYTKSGVNGYTRYDPSMVMIDQEQLLRDRYNLIYAR
jgi:hypothetical protein